MYTHKQLIRTGCTDDVTGQFFMSFLTTIEWIREYQLAISLRVQCVSLRVSLCVYRGVYLFNKWVILAEKETVRYTCKIRIYSWSKNTTFDLFQEQHCSTALILSATLN